MMTSVGAVRMTTSNCDQHIAAYSSGRKSLLATEIKEKPRHSSIVDKKLKQKIIFE